MGMRLSSLLDQFQFFRRPTETDNDSSYPIHMRRSFASPSSPASTSPPPHHPLSKQPPPSSIYSSRHSAPPIPPPKPTTTSSSTATATATSVFSTTSTLHRSSPFPIPRRPARFPRSRLQTKVRDYAFTPTDDRFIGLGSTAPKASQFPRLNKKLGGSKRARPTLSANSGRVEALPLDDINDNDGAESSDYPEEDEEEDDRPRIQFGPRFGAFFDSDSDSDSDDGDKKSGKGGTGAGAGAAGGGVRGGAGAWNSFSFRK